MTQNGYAQQATVTTDGYPVNGMTPNGYAQQARSRPTDTRSTG